MGDNLIMSNREIDKLKVIHSIIQHRLTWLEASEQLDVSERHIGRLVQRIRQEGNKGIIHRLRGCPSNHRLKPGVLEEAMRHVETTYRDFSPTFANEKLRKVHRIFISTYTLRQAMIDKKFWKAKKKKDQHRAWRERRSCVGELVQLDGSDHDWFEGRGPRCVLLIYIDDATSRILYGEFITVEDAVNLMSATRRYLTLHGRPVAFYVDKDSIYKINRQASIEEQLRDSQPLTQFTRAVGELGIQVIAANSPQAKGRVERGFKTHQDRLVKELRLQGISTIEEANRFLWDVYIPDHNARCAVEPANPTNAHRKLLKSHNLDRILSLQTERTLLNDFTLRFQNQFFQVLSKQPVRIKPKDKVIIEMRLDGSRHLRFKGRYLAFKPIAKAPYRPLGLLKQPSKRPNSGTLGYAAGHLYVGPWVVKKGDVKAYATMNSRR